MKKVKTDRGTFIFVEVPDTLSLDEYLNLHKTIFKIEHFEVISTTKNITEDQCENITGKIFCKCRYGSFMTFSHPCKKECQYPITAKESLDTLLLSESLDLNKNYLILKKL